jgi:hypothetical protein
MLETDYIFGGENMNSDIKVIGGFKTPSVDAELDAMCIMLILANKPADSRDSAPRDITFTEADASATPDRWDRIHQQGRYFLA